MNSMKTCSSVTLYSVKNSFSDISRNWVLSNMIRAFFKAVYFLHSRILWKKQLVIHFQITLNQVSDILVFFKVPKKRLNGSQMALGTLD